MKKQLTKTEKFERNVCLLCGFFALASLAFAALCIYNVIN